MFTEIDWVVSPFDHKYVLPIPDVSVWLVPAQMLTAPDGVMVGRDGSELTVTTVVPEITLWHPAAFVTLTV